MTKTAFLRTGESLVNAAEHREVVCNILDQTQAGNKTAPARVDG